MRYFVLFLSIYFIIPPLKSQENDFVLDKTIVSFVPQYLIINGLRIDVERQLKGRHYLQLCPQYYINNEPLYNESYDEMHGGGLFIYHKYFPEKNILKNGVYVAYGFTYNYFRFKYLDDNSQTQELKVNKLGGDLFIGYQYIYNKIVSIDIYAGMGNRNSFLSQKEADKFDDFSFGPFGYSYSGNLFIFGFRFGVLF